MRKAWLHLNENKLLPPAKTGGKAPAFPGLATMKVPYANRMTTDRIFAERRHIVKMVSFYAILDVLVRTCSALMTGRPAES